MIRLTKSDFEFISKSIENAKEFARTHKGNPNSSYPKMKPCEGSVKIDPKNPSQILLTFNNFPREDRFLFDYENHTFFGIPFNKIIEVLDEMNSALNVDIEDSMSRKLQELADGGENINVSYLEVPDDEYELMYSRYETELANYQIGLETGEISCDDVAEPIPPCSITESAINNWDWND